jgi:Mce-associated membrane protein
MEGDAGTGRLNPTIRDDHSDASTAETPEAAEVSQAPDGPSTSDGPGTHETAEATESSETDSLTDAAPDAVAEDARRPSRLGRGLVGTICAALVVLAAGGITAGYFAGRADANTRQIAAADQAALAAAMDCVAATQAPDTTAMTQAQSKILECSTGDFGVQAGLYSSVIAEAYQASNATVAVDELRSAVERHNDDGSVNVLVALRVKISNAQANNQQAGYRLRATMAFDQGRWRIAKLDQVTSG